MAYLSSSPPPMTMAAEDDNEEDISLGDIADVSESDDVTGMSEKLYSIPKEAIHITPKEIFRPDVEVMSPVCAINVNGIGIPQEDIWEKEDDCPNLSDLQDPGSPPCLDIEEDLSFDGSIPSPPSFTEEGKDEDEIVGEDPESLKLDLDVAPELGIPLSPLNDPHLPTLLPLPTETSEVLEDNEGFGDFANFDQAAWVSTDNHVPFTESIIQVPTELRSELVLDEDDGASPSDKCEDDDDFGEFDSASDPVGPVGTSSPRDILSVLHPSVTVVINDLFSNPIESKDVCDKVSMLNPNPVEGEGGDSVWTQIYEIETTPALVLNWSKTATQGQLMKLLKIDPRNIVLESKPRKYSPGNVPAFAMGLSTSTVLQPMKVDHIEPAQVPKNMEICEEKKEKDKVPLASFDWQKSGLKNPLDHNGAPPHIVTPTSDSTVSNSPPTSAPSSTVSSKTRSREAMAILESFPLLNFMQAQNLIVPLNDST